MTSGVFRFSPVPFFPLSLFNELHPLTLTTDSNKHGNAM